MPGEDSGHLSCVSMTVSPPRSVTLCSRPDLMRYQVYSCANTSEVYEDRLYRCYGVFQELGLTYTAVRRLDLPAKVKPSKSENSFTCLSDVFEG